MLNLLLENIDKVYVIFAVAIGIFAILMKWFYLFEAVRGIYLVDIKIYKRSVNTVYTMSTTMLTLLYLSAREPEPILLSAFCLLIGLWMLTALLSLFLSLLRVQIENKSSVRSLSGTCICKACILFVLLWLIH